MKTWKHNLALVLATVLLAGLSWAQNPPQGDQNDQAPPPQQDQTGQMGQMHRGMGPDHMLQMMTRRLNLTEEQQTQIKQLVEKHRADIDQINNEKLTRDERMQKMKALHQEMRSEVKAVLTPEQQKQFEQMPEHMRKGRHGRRGPGNAPPPPPPPDQDGPGAGF